MNSSLAHPRQLIEIATADFHVLLIRLGEVPKLFHTRRHRAASCGRGGGLFTDQKHAVFQPAADQGNPWDGFGHQA
jgi:hypothetical protein